MRGLVRILCLMACGVGCSTGSGGSDVAGSSGAAGTAGVGGGSGGAASGGAGTAGGGVSAAGGSGGSADGGTTTAGGSGAGDNGSGGSAGGAPHVVVSCDQVEVGTWEEVTPPEMVATDRWQAKNDGYGVHAIAIDPINTANVLLGSDRMGDYRTTDCGATWKHLNTGQGGAEMDGGVGWTWAIDPYDSDTFYGVSGYGTMGVFKTTNAGDDWDQVLPADVKQYFVSNGFTQHVRPDPTTSGHFVASPHFFCENGHGGYCFLETTDAGSSWNVIDNKLSDGSDLPGDEGTRLYVENHDRWFVGQAGLYRTDDAGQNWTKVPSINNYAYEVHHRPGGKYYVPTDFKVAQSEDGITWTVLDNAPYATIVTTSETRIYAMSAIFCGDPSDHNLASAPIDDPTNWTYDTAYPSKGPANFQSMQYDVDHNILYVSSCYGGLWRLRTE